MQAQMTSPNRTLFIGLLFIALIAFLLIVVIGPAMQALEAAPPIGGSSMPQAEWQALQRSYFAQFIDPSDPLYATRILDPYNPEWWRAFPRKDVDRISAALDDYFADSDFNDMKLGAVQEAL